MVVMEVQEEVLDQNQIVQDQVTHHQLVPHKVMMVVVQVQLPQQIRQVEEVLQL
jgi:hypothetical protein